MKRLAPIAAMGLALAGCSGSHASSPPARPHYPVVIHLPLVVPARGQLHMRRFPQFVSHTRLAILTTGSSSCPSVPDELVVVSRHAIRIHLTIGSWDGGKLVAHAPPGGVCTADLGPTPMLVAIDPKLVDVHHPLKIRVFYRDSKQPEVWTAGPLKS